MIITHFVTLLQSEPSIGLQPDISIVVRPSGGFILIGDDGVAVLSKEVPDVGFAALSVPASNTVLQVYGR